MARAGNVLYFAGTFGYVGLPCGGGVPISVASGRPLARFPRVAGTVRAVVSDGEGGWFIGGDFVAVEGVPRLNLAHLSADGSLASWDPRAEPNDELARSGDPTPPGTVLALARHGHTLYVGGHFTSIGSRPIQRLAAVDTRSGEVLPEDWAPDAEVRALGVHAGRLYVGGAFTKLGGAGRSRLAALDANTGDLLDWSPAADGTVLALAFKGTRVYAGGEFDHVGGLSRNSLAEIDVSTGAVTRWDAELKPIRQYLGHGSWVWPFVAGLAVQGSTLYATGYFGYAGNSLRAGLVALDLGTARAKPFDARFGGGYGNALAIEGNVLYVTGYLIQIGGAERPNLAAVDATTGDALAWNPRAYGIGFAMGAQNGVVFAGGQFRSMADWEARPGLAALDARTGRLLPWQPSDTRVGITDLLGTETTLYVSGALGTLAGEPRDKLAAFDGTTGALLPWAPVITPRASERNAPVRCLARIGDRIYLGGSFIGVNGVGRRSLAAVDAKSGELLDWNPDVRRWSAAIAAMGVAGPSVYVAGIFDSVGGKPRRDLAALDAISGRALEWDSQPGFYMWARLDGFPNLMSIAPGPAGVHVGGWYQRLAGQDRFCLAAFDPTGAMTPFDARLEDNGEWVLGERPTARSMVLHGGVLYVGGSFDRIGGEARRNVAALDAATGSALDWDPDAGVETGSLDLGVEELCLSDGQLYVGGNFTRFAGYPSSGLAVIPLDESARARRVEQAPASPPRPRITLDFEYGPSRLDRVEALRFTIPLATAVTVEIFDVLGRRAAMPLDREAFAPGTHTVTLDTRGWNSGLYFCRLSVDGSAVVRKLPLLR